MLLIAAMAALVGVFGALAAAVLVRLIDLITSIAYFHQFAATGLTPAQNHLGFWAVGVPVVGGLVIGLMARYGSEKIRGHGIPEAMEAILIGRSRLSAKVAVLKPLSSAISIGTGGPFGAEGPIIMTGAALGSVFAQAFHMSASERKTLLVSGAAAGMAAIFNAPLAAVLLAVELLLFEWKPRSLVPVAIAATVGAALRAPLLGAGAVFPVAPHAALGIEGLAAALIVGVIAGLAATLLTQLVYACEDGFLRLPIHWMWWPALGGIVVGLGGLVAPRALGVGYDVIRDLFAGNLVGGVLLALLVAKAVMWSVALGSGTSGGVLAPLLIMGGALGALEAGIVHGNDPGLWAILSMAAVMGGTMRSPLTATVFLLELTHDVNLIGGLLIACIAAHAVTVLLMRRSILTEKVARRGHHVLREYAVNPLALFRVEDVMLPPTATVRDSTIIDARFQRLVQEDPLLSRARAWPLVSEAGELVGILTQGDVLRALDRDPRGERTALESGTPVPTVAHPEELLEEAMNAMIVRGVKQLPVVSRREPRRLLGVVDGAAIATAWSALRDDEHVREAGHLMAQLRLFRRRMRKVRRGAAPGGEAGDVAA
jgi:H+/Cl- antiporter ClcA/predicted transcriptional regulator